MAPRSRGAYPGSARNRPPMRIWRVRSPDGPSRRPARHRLRDDETPVGHGHGHSPPAPVERRVRVLIAALLVPCALATVLGLVLLYPFAAPPAADETAPVRVDGHVTA